MTFGKNLQKHRLARGLSISELAQISSMSRQMILMIEMQQRRKPSMDAINALAKALKVSVEVLIADDTIPNSKQTPETTKQAAALLMESPEAFAVAQLAICRAKGLIPPSKRR